MVYIRMWSYTHALTPIYYTDNVYRSGIERGFIDIISVIQYRLHSIRSLYIHNIIKYMLRIL